jgi:Tfp pilus assembly protein PilF
VSKRKPARTSATPAVTPARQLSARNRALAIVALIFLVAVVYAPVRQYPFVNWDDADYVEKNAHVLAGLTGETFNWALTANAAGNWHPVTMLSHAMVVEVFGAGPEPQHVVNAVLHLANTLLLFWLLAGMTGAIGRSCVVAAVFAVHPLHVESVAWISERKDVLSTFFWLLALWMYLIYVRRRRIAPYLGLVAFFALALMSKPMAVTFPLVLLLLDWWPLRRSSEAGPLHPASLLVEKIPLVALALGAAVVTLVFQSKAGAVASTGLVDRVMGAIEAYVMYLAQTFWPAGLSPFYPPHATSIALTGAGALALIGITIAAVRLRETWPVLLVGWFWYLIVLLPTVGIVKVGEQARADRYMYLPIVGILLVVTWAGPSLIRRFRLPPVATTGIVSAVLIALVTVSRLQVSYWSDSVTLWRRAVSVTTDSRRAYENLGQALRERGELAEAYASYQRALELSEPKSRAPMNNSMGIVATRQGRTREAIAHFEAAVRIDSKFAEAQTNLGNALASDRRPGEAVNHFRAALAIDPASVETQLGLAGVLASLGQQDEARQHYQEAIRLDPRMAEAHAGYGTSLALTGDLEGAIRALTEAVRLNPNLVNANLNLGLILAQKGDRARAIPYLEKALQLNPSLAAARDALQAIRK